MKNSIIEMLIWAFITTCLIIGIVLTAQKRTEIKPKTYTIILNDVPEAMPAEGGLLEVDFFKGDTIYVNSVP